MIIISRLSCSSSIEGSPGCRSPPHPCRCSSRRRDRPAAREGEGQLHACGVLLRDFRGLGRFVGAIRWAGGRAPRRERRCTDGSFKRTLRRSRARRVVERPESRAYGLHHPHSRPCSPEIRGWQAASLPQQRFAASDFRRNPLKRVPRSKLKICGTRAPKSAEPGFWEGGETPTESRIEFSQKTARRRDFCGDCRGTSTLEDPFRRQEPAPRPPQP